MCVQTEAYVDSGAFCSIFQLEMLEALQLQEREGKKQKFKVGDGGFLNACVFRLPVQIGTVKFRARVGFSDELRIGFNLLGRQTIFNQFEEVAFNERAGKVFFR